MKTLKRRAKEARLAAGYTQEQLRSLTGLSICAIRSIEKENGTIYPNILTVYKIAKALGVSIDWLCGLEESK